MTLATLTRLITILLAALFAPAGSMARVRGFDLAQLYLFARGLAKLHKRGDRLRYPGESLAIVAARIDRIAWLAFDPCAALRHLARRVRGWQRARLGEAAAPEGAPVCMARVVRAGVVVAIACADSS